MNKIINKNNFIFKIIEKDILINKLKEINTRFAPDPSGFLHLGHAKSIFINFNIAKIYGGKFNLRFDDTNSFKECNIYIENIKKDIKWLGLYWDNEKYTSDYFYNIFNYAIYLIKKGLAYVDELPINKFLEYKGNLNKPGIESIYRNRTIKENIKCFYNMKNGLYKENEACLRAKINMKSSNIFMRDPVLYKIRYKEHFRTKNKWCIYPTYDFSHCISDYLEEITYSLCDISFQNNRELYCWILNSLDIKKNKPKQYEFYKLNIEYSLLSKRKINILIKNNFLKKWNDPRILTLSGLKKRGYTSNSIKVFCESIGVTKKDSLIKINYLENILKKDLENKSIKIMSVLNPIILYIINFKKNYEIINKSCFYIKNELKVRKIIFSNLLYVDKYDFLNSNKNKRIYVGDYIKLKYSYILKVIDIFKDINNNILKINCLYFENTLNTIYIENIKVKKIIHWVSSYKNYKSKYRIFNYLFNDSNIEKNKNFIKSINKNSFLLKNGFTEKNSINLLKHIPYKLEKVGYFYISKINYSKSNIILNKIVDLK